MKRRTIVNMLLIAITLSAMGCAQNETVKKDAGLVPATPQKAVETSKDATSQANTLAPAKTSAVDTKEGQIVPAASSPDAQQKGSAQQAPPAVVYFGFDSYILTNESRDTLLSNFKILASRPSIQIEGHCDERGSSEYNLALGEKRAKSAQAYLVTLGYPAGKIATISYGKERPADQGHDEAAWAKNRRDEFKIVK